MSKSKYLNDFGNAACVQWETGTDTTEIKGENILVAKASCMDFAAQIVREHNSHEKLVEAVKLVLHELAGDGITEATHTKCCQALMYATEGKI